jgi:hypothetical protein
MAVRSSPHLAQDDGGKRSRRSKAVGDLYTLIYELTVPCPVRGTLSLSFIVHLRVCFSAQSSLVRLSLLGYRSDIIAHEAARLPEPHRSPPTLCAMSEVVLSLGNMFKHMTSHRRSRRTQDTGSKVLRSLVAKERCDLHRAISFGSFRCTTVTRGAPGTLLLCRR